MPEIQELFQDTINGLKEQGYKVKGGRENICYLDTKKNSIKVFFHDFTGHWEKLKSYYEKDIESIIHVAFIAPANSREEKEQYPGLKQKVIDAISSQGYERKTGYLVKDEAKVKVRYAAVIKIKLERYSSKTVRENLEAAKRRDEAVSAGIKLNVRKLDEPFDV